MVGTPQRSQQQKRKPPSVTEHQSLNCIYQSPHLRYIYFLLNLHRHESVLNSAQVSFSCIYILWAKHISCTAPRSERITTTACYPVSEDRTRSACIPRALQEDIRLISGEWTFFRPQAHYSPKSENHPLPTEQLRPQSFALDDESTREKTTTHSPDSARSIRLPSKTAFTKTVSTYYPAPALQQRRLRFLRLYHMG